MLRPRAAGDAVILCIPDSWCAPRCCAPDYNGLCNAIYGWEWFEARMFEGYCRLSMNYTQLKDI